MERGIVVGCDEELEWLLPWWWKYYTLYNDYPVSFFDFGMSKPALAWCKQRGDVVSLNIPSDFIPLKEEVASSDQEEWEKRYTDKIWERRKTWFKKPFALVKASYDVSVWIDIDCEVCSSLNSLFEVWDHSTDLGITPSASYFPHQPLVYSSGVMIFKKNAPFLNQWIELCLKESHRFLGDENALTELIATKALNIHELPKIYNWIVSMEGGFHITPIIVHWGGQGGKLFLKKFGGYHDHRKQV